MNQIRRNLIATVSVINLPMISNLDPYGMSDIFKYSGGITAPEYYRDFPLE